jgi:hypothetical protein
MPVATRFAAGVAVLMMAAAGSLPSAQAQTAGRFTFQPIDGGVMRLDTETGHVSHCTKSGDSLACRSVADDRAALQEEIDRLRRENDELRLGGKPSTPGITGKLQLPSEEDLDKAMGLFEKMMRRMMKTFREDGQGPERL